MFNQPAITGLDQVLVDKQEICQRPTITLLGLVTAKPLFLIHFQVDRDCCFGSVSYVGQNLGVSNSIEND